MQQPDSYPHQQSAYGGQQQEQLGVLPGGFVLFRPEPVAEQGGAGHRQPEEEGDEDALQRPQRGHDGERIRAKMSIEKAVDQHAEGPEPVVEQQWQGDQGETHHLLAPKGGPPVDFTRDQAGLLAHQIEEQQCCLQQAGNRGAPGRACHAHGLEAKMAEDEGIVEDDIGDDGDDADTGRRRRVAHGSQGRLQRHYDGGAEDGGAGDHQELIGQQAQLGVLAGKAQYAARREYIDERKRQAHQQGTDQRQRQGAAHPGQLAATVILGCQYRDSPREPRYHQQIEEEDPVTQADRRHCRGAKLAHHHDVDETQQGEHHGLQ